MQQRTRPGGRGREAPRARAATRQNRPNARPTVARRAVSTGGAALRTRAPQPRRFTSRAVVLSLVLLVLLLAYAYPVRVYLAQEAEIAAYEQSQERQAAKVAEMAARARKWDDPEYVISQARQRLHMVLPGEKPYVVVDPSRAQTADPADVPGAEKTSRPWYGKLWSSVEAADKQ
ncbi:septum formation initiator family protein [Dactylosporangium sp. AC04546]|uniref:FtsB family cell division protein n=1 Tax=Dactylosporangium sp. AC04546 TaxID=2862460 RepID=UPI001EE0A897|nr:septum formation initiator family protein [Dactylosporangium sp. AC04546]WVK83083.1 septum formation initiator family protein [Dactylosporangium sp. AC04546]